jgi:hypothetical protein
VYSRSARGASDRYSGSQGEHLDEYVIFSAFGGTLRLSFDRLELNPVPQAAGDAVDALFPDDLPQYIARGPHQVSFRRAHPPPAPRLSPEATTEDGAFMEPSGRNRWQPMANGTAARTARIGENRCDGLRSVAAGSAW